MKNAELFILAALGITAALVVSNKEKIVQKISDAISEKRIQTLHPKVREFARLFLFKAEQEGIFLRVTSAYRDHKEQGELYAQGRTKPGKIVTNAKPGQSNHNFGTAIDVVPIENGKANFNTTQWAKIAAIGKSFGFSWGGDWKSFKDKPHFEMNFGKTLKQMQSLYASANFKEGYINLG